MKTQNISASTFQGGVKIHQTVSPELTKAIKTSPAMKKFGMFYSAEVSSIRIGSHDMKQSYSGLCIDNVKPRNIFVSIYDFVTGRKDKMFRGINFNSHRETDAGLIQLLGTMKKNEFVKMIISKNF